MWPNKANGDPNHIIPLSECHFPQTPADLSPTVRTINFMINRRSTGEDHLIMPLRDEIIRIINNPRDSHADGGAADACCCYCGLVDNNPQTGDCIIIIIIFWLMVATVEENSVTNSFLFLLTCWHFSDALSHPPNARVDSCYIHLGTPQHCHCFPSLAVQRSFCCSC